MSRTQVAVGLVVLGFAAHVACAGGSGATGTPDADPAGKRDTALEHEPCDLSKPGALPMDADLDGRPEILRVMEGERELCRAIDLNRDGIVERFVYFDEQGRERRMESGFDTDDRPDEVTHLTAGVVVRKERQTNHDGKIDTWDYFDQGALAREERDSNGDGLVDQWWTFTAARPDCPTVVIDVDGNGKPDDQTRMSMCDEKLGAPDAGSTPKGRDAGAAPRDAGTRTVPSAPDAAADDEGSPYAPATDGEDGYE
jgi:hypothetical protein